MATSEQRGRPVTHDGIREARILANEVTLSQLNSMVKNDSAADISDILRKESSSYVSLVKELAASFNPASNNKTTSADSPPSVATGLLDLPGDNTVKVIQPLSRSISDLAHTVQDDENHDFLSKGIAATLNQAIRGGEILFQLHHTFVIGIGPSIVVKVSLYLDPDHIDNIQYLTTHIPELPIPRCLGVLRSGQWTYFFMSRAPGTTLESVWPKLSTKQKTSVQEQLNHLFQILRSQPHVDSKSRVRLGSFVSGVCKDVRRTQRVSSEPLWTEADFNDFLLNCSNKTVTPWIKMVRSFMKDDHRIVMTHGDLHPRNIMVTLQLDESSTSQEIIETTEMAVRVSSIIDWEAGGWYPESWEFVKAMSMIDPRGPLSDWIDFLPTDAIGYFPVEYSVDHLLDQWLG